MGVVHTPRPLTAIARAIVKRRRHAGVKCDGFDPSLGQSALQNPQTYRIQVGIFDYELGYMNNASFLSFAKSWIDLPSFCAHRRLSEMISRHGTRGPKPACRRLVRAKSSVKTTLLASLTFVGSPATKEIRSDCSYKMSKNGSSTETSLIDFRRACASSFWPPSVPSSLPSSPSFRLSVPSFRSFALL